jgi:hypothetical protein
MTDAFPPDVRRVNSKALLQVLRHYLTRDQYVPAYGAWDAGTHEFGNIIGSITLKCQFYGGSEYLFATSQGATRRPEWTRDSWL